jgi:hypothetical protein
MSLLARPEHDGVAQQLRARDEHRKAEEARRALLVREVSEAVRDKLRAKEKEFEEKKNGYRGIDGKIKKAERALDKHIEKIRDARRAKLEHKARGLETGKVKNTLSRDLRSAQLDLEKLPEKIKQLQQEVAGLKVELKAARDKEDVMIAAIKSSSLAPKGKPGDKQKTAKAPTGPAQVIGKKRKATNEPSREPLQQVKRQKAGPAKVTTSQAQGVKPGEPTAPACAPSQSTPARKAHPSTTKRMVPPGPNKLKQAGKDALRAQTSGVTKHESTAKGPTRSSSAKVNTSAVKAAVKATGGTDSSQRPRDGSRQDQKPAPKSTKPSSPRTGPGDQAPGQKRSRKLSAGSKAAKTSAPGTGSNGKISGASEAASSTGSGAAASPAEKDARDGSSEKTARQVTADDTAARSSSQPNGKKRSASDDADDSSEESKRQKLSARSEPKGLVNPWNACFSNAVIQFLDAALEGYDVDALLGELNDVETFGLTARDISRFDSTAFAGQMPRDLDTKETALRSAIKTAARAGETDKLSAAKHLRKVLEEMRRDSQEERIANISPYLLQSVRAWGAADDADRPDDEISERQKMSGDSQEDAFEYYQLLLNDLIADTSAGDGDALNEAFQIESETRECCTDADCGMKSDPRKAINNYHNVDVKLEKGEESTSLKKLLEASLESPKVGFYCKDEKCQIGDIVTRTTFTKVPDSLVVRLNRTTYSEQQAHKVTAVVELNNTLNVEGSEYSLHPVIMHRGTINNGHYTIYRKHQERWYLLDDKRCIAEGPEDMAGVARKRGQPVMALYKKVKA